MQSARTVCTIRVSSARVAVGRPAVLTEVKPTPTPMIMRPCDSSCRVAMALAVTLAWRVTGLVTPVPRRMRDVDAAATPSSVYISRQIICESPNQRES